MSGEITSLDRVREILTGAKTIAVLGASTKPERPAYYVPDYLHEQGYRVLPVNPLHRGERLWGETFREKLQELGEPIDIVDMFRAAPALPQHVDDILAMRPLPKVVWFQLGIRNDAVAQQLIAAGIDVVQDRCTLADHRRFGIGRRE